MLVVQQKNAGFKCRSQESPFSSSPLLLLSAYTERQLTCQSPRQTYKHKSSS